MTPSFYPFPPAFPIRPSASTKDGWYSKSRGDDWLPTIPALRNPSLASLSTSPLFLRPTTTHYLPANPSSLHRNPTNFAILLHYFVRFAYLTALWSPPIRLVPSPPTPLHLRPYPLPYFARFAHTLSLVTAISSPFHRCFPFWFVT